MSTTRLAIGLLAGATAALLSVAIPAAATQPAAPTAPHALAAPAAPNSARLSHTDVAGVQRGAVVRQQTAGQVAGFLAAHQGLLAHGATNNAVGPHQTIHPAQGTGLVDVGNDQGVYAEQSVTTALHPTNSGTTIYTPTMYPAGGSCVEVTTVYTENTQAVEAWDWCNKIDFEASVPINSSFISRYTNGSGAYTAEIVQTNASSNTWTSYLYDYSTSAWDTLFSSSGSTQAGTTGWDVNELYSDVDSNGESYACESMAGLTFSASDIQVDLGGTWQAAAPGNANTEFDQPASAFDCPAMQYQMIQDYDHWQVLD